MLARMSQMARDAVSSLAHLFLASFSRPSLCAGLVVLGMWLVAGGGAHAKPSFALAMDPASAAPDGALRDMAAAALQVLNQRGQTVVAVPDRLAGCELPACAEELRQATGASHELRIVAHYDREAFKASVELWDLAPPRLVTSRTSECAICDLRDFTEAGRALTTALLDEVDFDSSPVSQEPAAVAPAAPEAVKPTDSTGLRILKHPVFLAGAALGAVLATVGIVSLARDGDPVCREGEPEPCDFVRDSRGVGTALTLAGVGTAALGSVAAWLMVSPTARSGEIDGVALRVSGRF